MIAPSAALRTSPCRALPTRRLLEHLARCLLLLAMGAIAARSSPADAQARDPATVDACALLSTADAESAADVVRRADGRGTGTRYAIDASKQDLGGINPIAYCKVVLTETDGDGYGGVIGLQVGSASDFAFYKGHGEPVEGIGDEAVRVTGSTIVRVGDLMLSIGQNSFDPRLTDEFLRKAAMRLK